MSEFWVCWMKRMRGNSKQNEANQSPPHQFPLHFTNDVLLERFQHILFVRNEKH